ncbi:hypothetical protein EDM00_07680 [Ornithobacterium rhinotracheale]|uniref:hypothetical protein n=1 Tax=Ornithobacterium rhinotracheale TaxID=28251 RepID=UPI00129C4619|nr:hypothetical protein [Ornithobacterium rhinotracheale]MRI63867.1 hypothetical protein [Ornithobacterium rhinotracheale]
MSSVKNIIFDVLYYSITFVLEFFFCAVLALLFYWILGFVFKKFKLNQDFFIYKYRKIIAVLLLLVLMSGHWYFTQYPLPSFYEKHYEIVTEQALPASAKIISKKYKAPSFGGVDYQVKMHVELSPDDYNKLLVQMKKADKMYLVEPSKNFKDSISFMFEKMSKYEIEYVTFYKDLKTVKISFFGL